MIQLHNLPNGTYHYGVTTLCKTSDNEDKPRNYTIRISHTGNQGNRIDSVNKNLGFITWFIPEEITIERIKEEAKNYTENGSPDYLYEFEGVFDESDQCICCLEKLDENNISDIATDISPLCVKCEDRFWVCEHCGALMDDMDFEDAGNVCWNCEEPQ